MKFTILGTDTSEPTLEVTYVDRHTHQGTGTRTHSIGLWVKNDHDGFVSFGADYGDFKTHSINGVSVDKLDNIILSTIAGSTYRYGMTEQEFIDSHTFNCHYLGRLRFDTVEEMISLLKRDVTLEEVKSWETEV